MPTYTTLSTDDDILLVHPGARDLLWRDPTTGVAETTFDRARKVAYDQIVRDLARRSPPLTLADLTTAAELKLAEVYLTLAELFAVARQVSDSDFYRAEATRYRQRYDSEINGPLTTGYGVSAVRTARLGRC